MLVSLVLLPIYSYRILFPFYNYNAAYVVVAVTLTRYLFFLEFSWLRHRFVLLAATAFLMIPLLFWQVQGLNEFITYLDNYGPDVFVLALEGQTATGMLTYLRSEFYFFGVWACIAGLAWPLRVLFHVWANYRKRETRQQRVQ
ncbi:MAG: hypothetical protein HC821_00050 [Lewinella sp.]|nr:hypothetical protein [Lewinella sp.]